MDKDVVEPAADAQDGADETEPLNEDGGGEAFRFEKPLVRLFILCAFLLLGELLWLFVIGPCIPLANVEIAGVDKLNRITILDKAGITPRTSYFSFNVVKAGEGLRSIPQIERAEVVKKFPDAVSIHLTGRSPAALSLAVEDGRIVPVVFDKEGVVFQIGDAEGAASWGSLPIISGLVFENAHVGVRLPEFLAPLLRSLRELQDTAPEMLAAISELQITMKGSDAFELTLFPAQTPVRIRIGAELSAEKISYALLLLDVLAEKHINVDEIDFRSGTASYKAREL